jgi:predicted nucleic-acid-binding Zn-ribbon protein
MSNQECPKCGSKFPTGSGWANTAISTLMIAPAVPDMATQIRCPKCGQLFAEGEVRYLRSPGSKSLVFVLLLLFIGMLAWTLN